MVVMLLVLVFILLVLPCVLMPEQVWKAFNVGDDGLDYSFHDINIVALSELSEATPSSMQKLIY